MGTNFYLQQRNPKTGRCKDIHICKLSYGWQPSLRGYRESRGDDFDILSWVEWKWFLMKETRGNGSIIFDEYDDPIELNSFFERIEEKQKDPKNLKNTARDHGIKDYPTDYWVDDNGYGFTQREFS